ncbi:hypothetical protein J2S55_008831 [Streptosporangium brasiliense]|uniref:Uncharacterized protein n=1 Tax=Streptosporangium brasiliense TaxID=47480 RepID=A0ABT9RJY1_9ACTN|nr:hypothetical protein [Streptosporangium brasiliense]
MRMKLTTIALASALTGGALCAGVPFHVIVP